MVKHIILWTLKDEYSNEEKNEIKLAIKKNLELLMGKIDGLIKIDVEINPLESSNADLMLYSEFENKDALKCYSSHPDHVYVADTFVRPYTKMRNCIDFEC